MSFDPRTQLPPLPSARKPTKIVQQEEKNDSDKDEQLEVFFNEYENEPPSKEPRLREGDEFADLAVDATSIITSIEKAGSSTPPQTFDNAPFQDQATTVPQTTNHQLQFSSYPPLPRSTTTAVINHFLLSSTKFLNNFAASADERLSFCAERIHNLENQMALLESKLNSIPGTEDGGQV